MSRKVGSTTVATLVAIVAADTSSFDGKGMDRKELVRLANIAKRYESAIAALSSEDNYVRESVIQKGKDFLFAKERAENPPAKPGRKISPSVLAAVKQHYPHKYSSFASNLLDTKERNMILNSCRAFAKLGAVGPAASAE